MKQTIQEKVEQQAVRAFYFALGEVLAHGLEHKHQLLTLELNQASNKSNEKEKIEVYDLTSASHDPSDILTYSFGSEKKAVGFQKLLKLLV